MTQGAWLCKQVQVLGDAQQTPRDGNVVETRLQGETGPVQLLLGIQENFLFSVIDWPFHQTSRKILFPVSPFFKASHLGTSGLPATVQGPLLGLSIDA